MSDRVGYYEVIKVAADEKEFIEKNTIYRGKKLCEKVRPILAQLQIPLVFSWKTAIDFYSNCLIVEQNRENYSEIAL